MHHMTQSHNCCLATHVCQQRQCTSACMLTSVLSHSALQQQGAELAHRDKINTTLHSDGTSTAESSACALAETLAQQHCSGSSTAKPPAALMLLHTPTLPSAWIHTLSLNAAVQHLQHLLMSRRQHSGVCLRPPAGAATAAAANTP